MRTRRASGCFTAWSDSGSGRALADRDLYLPKSWTSDRDRCQAAKIPDERGFATKGELARDIVRRCLAAGLPAAWVTADEAYGQDWNFRRLLEQLGLGYVVAVLKSQQIKSLAGIWRIDELIDEAPRRCPAAAVLWRRGEGPTRLPLGRGETARQHHLRSGSADPSPLGAGPPQSLRPRRDRLLPRSRARRHRDRRTLPGRRQPVGGGRWAVGGGRSRNASKPRRTNVALTSTKSAATPAGTGTPPSPCSPTPF
ncbi:transposase [Streptomyces sp. NBC_01116]|uniref:transposase n=1 Tax=Streptomyces sp. NBC_01116 TaxID=2903752 RepID=UPI00352FBD48